MIIGLPKFVPLQLAERNGETRRSNCTLWHYKLKVEYSNFLLSKLSQWANLTYNWYKDECLQICMWNNIVVSREFSGEAPQ